MPLRITSLNPWADAPQPTAAWLAALPGSDLARRCAKPEDPKLMRMARLDRDWHAECARCFDRMEHPQLSFLPSRVVGPTGFAPLVGETPAAGEQLWLICFAQHLNQLGKLAGPALGALKKRGWRILYYAFDEASRMMPCFREVAPHLDILVHDESPLDEAAAAALPASCRRLHRSWVANLVPFEAPFNEEPERRLLFLGSEMGFTPHRRRQVEFLQQKFKDRFTAYYDHSVAVSDRLALGRFKAGLCPEGRKFASPHMAATHTDRPFWTGCLGMVPVSEDSLQGGRLESLHREGLILRYPHGNLQALAEACERALETGPEERRRIHAHFNRHETVGSVVAGLIAEAQS